jgi:hypothetical protein
MAASARGSVVRYLSSTFSDLYQDGDERHSGWGEHAFSYNPGLALDRGVSVVTIKSKPTQGDPASRFLVNGAYRLSVRLSQAAFARRFGRPSRWLPAGEWPDPAVDYHVADQICPDPTGAWVALCVLNPSAATFEHLKPTIQEAYTLCRAEWPSALARRRRARQATNSLSTPPVHAGDSRPHRGGGQGPTSPRRRAAAPSRRRAPGRRLAAPITSQTGHVHIRPGHLSAPPLPAGHHAVFHHGGQRLLGTMAAVPSPVRKTCPRGPGKAASRAGTIQRGMPAAAPGPSFRQSPLPPAPSQGRVIYPATHLPFWPSRRLPPRRAQASPGHGPLWRRVHGRARRSRRPHSLPQHP